MEEYTYAIWADEYEKSSDLTYRIANQIRTATKRITRNSITFDQIKTLFKNIIHASRYWTGSTFVGCKKDPRIEKAYQAFFKALYDFVLTFREMNLPIFQECADLILYRGTIYRYLGHHDPEDGKDKVEPVYNDIFVSWSKETKNTYIEGKLLGTMTWMSAEIRAPYYGIDLEGLAEAIGILVGLDCELSRANEREVVFPTITECITEVKYIEEDEEDDQT